MFFLLWVRGAEEEGGGGEGVWDGWRAGAAVAGGAGAGGEEGEEVVREVLEGGYFVCECWDGLIW